MEYYEVKRQVALLLSLIRGKVQSAEFFAQGKIGRREELYAKQIKGNQAKTIAWELMQINQIIKQSPSHLLWMGLRFSTSTGDTHELICNLYGDVILRPDIKKQCNETIAIKNLY